MLWRSSVNSVMLIFRGCLLCDCYQEETMLLTWLTITNGRQQFAPHSNYCNQTITWMFSASALVAASYRNPVVPPTSSEFKPGMSHFHPQSNVTSSSSVAKLFGGFLLTDPAETERSSISRPVGFFCFVRAVPSSLQHQAGQYVMVGRKQLLKCIRGAGLIFHDTDNVW